MFCNKFYQLRFLPIDPLNKPSASEVNLAIEAMLAVRPGVNRIPLEYIILNGGVVGELTFAEAQQQFNQINRDCEIVGVKMELAVPLSKALNRIWRHVKSCYQLSWVGWRFRLNPFMTLARLYLADTVTVFKEPGELMLAAQNEVIQFRGNEKQWILIHRLGSIEQPQEITTRIENKNIDPEFLFLFFRCVDSLIAWKPGQVRHP